MKHTPLLLILITLSGCKVGPTYHPPVTPMPPSYNEASDDCSNAINDENLCRWWTIFNDPFLDNLLEETIQGNFDYRIALEKIFQARAQYCQQTAQLFPEFDSTFQTSRYRTSSSFASAAAQTLSATPISRIQDFFQMGFDALWQIDLFGKIRRASDAAHNIWEATAEEARGIKILVLSEVANTYAMICTFQEKVDIASHIVDIDEQLLEISKTRFDGGLTNEQEVQNAIATLESNRANLLTTQAALKLNIYSLATLLGRHPESIIDDFQIKRPIPYATDRIPIGLPSDLLRRRPDIRAAERNLAATTEQIGIAIADLFPQVSLTGSSGSFAVNPLQGANVGWSSDTANKLFNNGSRVWGIGTLITFPLFDFGKRQAGVRIQTSLQQQAYLTYQKTVINALQEVEQALTSYFIDEKKLQNNSKEVEAHQRTLDLVSNEFRAGLVDYTKVMQAKEIWLISFKTLTDSQQALTTDLIALYKALGGDW